jgi:hypothetical protein
MIYNFLDNHKDKIILLNPSKQTMSYDIKHWKKWVKSVLDSELKEIHSKFSGKISREDLFNYAILAKENKLEIHFFLACMIWGYGENEGESKKNSDSRGAYRIEKMFKDEVNSKKIRELIKESFDYLCKNDIEKAFYKLSEIKGLSISFLSKFIYFVTRGLNLNKFGLIYDKRVAVSLVRLNSINEEITNIVNINPSIEYEHFEKYINMIHEIASRLECNADSIELYLFEQATVKT